jgi:hypothetical protein
MVTGKVKPKKGGAPCTPTEKSKHQQAAILRFRRDNPSWTYAEIGRALPPPLGPLGETQTWKLFKRALKEIIQEPAEEVLQMELARLDELHNEVLKALRSFFPVVSHGRVVRDIVEDAQGNPIINPATGKPITIRLEDIGAKLQVVDRALKIMERRAKYLGLDKDKGDPNKEGLTPEEFAVKILGAVSAMDQMSGSGS